MQIQSNSQLWQIPKYFSKSRRIEVVEEIEDPLDFIDNLLATPHPNGEKLWMYTQGKIVEGIEPDLIKRHLAMCPHCKKLAIRLGWPESDIKH